MEIRILGTGCPKCKRLTELTHEALEAVGVEATIVKVTSLDEIMEHGVLNTPGLVIDGRVVSAGRLPRREEIEGWLRDAAAPAREDACCCCCECDCDDDCDDDCDCSCHDEGDCDCGDDCGDDCDCSCHDECCC